MDWASKRSFTAAKNIRCTAGNIKTPRWRDCTSIHAWFMILTEIRKSAFWVASGSAYSSISPMHQSVNPRVAQRPIRSASANRVLSSYRHLSQAFYRNLRVSLLSLDYTLFIITLSPFDSQDPHISSPMSEQPSQPQFVSGFGGSGTTSLASLDESCQVFRRPKMLKLASSLNDFEVFGV